MDYLKLGNTGLDVSRLCLGCMTYGEPGRGAHPWTLNEEKSRPLIRQAVEAGINFFDTANIYSDGSSEEIVGRALKEFTRRDEVVIATKVNGRMHAGPNGAGLSRKAILQGSHRCCTRPRPTAGRVSSPCRTTSTCSIAKKSARCFPCARPRASA